MTNLDFSYHYPSEIIFRDDAIEDIPSRLPTRGAVLLVVGEHTVKSGLKARLDDLLKDFPTTSKVGVPPEPPLAAVDELLELGRSNDVVAVVAVGGGSVIDAAKAAAAIIPTEGSTSDYFHGTREIRRKGLFFVAAPTTAGTGAEITKNSVLTETESKIKKSIRHPAMVADVALIDPSLTLSCPPALTAASGLDAFTQAVESFTTQKANAGTRALSEAAVRLLLTHLRGAYERPDDLAARRLVAEGSLLSAMAFSQSGLGAAHGLAHPIGSLLGVPHGVACAILLRSTLAWNAPVSGDDYRRLANACGLPDERAFLNAALELCETLNIPESFSDFGLNDTHFPFIVKNCRGNSMSGNPREMSDDDVIRLLSFLSR